MSTRLALPPRAYTNDANGNTLTGGGRTNTWDSQNRLVQCAFNGTTTTSTYAADGLRHRSVVGANTTDMVLDQTMQVRELLNGAVKATYLVGPRGPEYRRDDQAGTIRWYVYDGLGSVVGEVAPDGTLTRAQTFDVYGAVRTSTGTATSKHKFVGSLGQPSDDETGLIYMRARHYDPVCGRFVSEDPGRHGGNWFAYTNNSPVFHVDTSGREADLVEVGVANSMAGFMTQFMTSVANALGATIEVGAEAFEVEGQELVGECTGFVVGGLEEGLGLGQDEFQNWAIRVMGGAGNQFLKAWVRTNAEQEVWLLLGEEGEVLASHATPYVGGLRLGL